MVINPLINGRDFTKCLVDSGSNINIMYLDTLHKKNLMETNLRRTSTMFHGVVPGQEAQSLGGITLPVAFVYFNNYRQERMTFEVAPFKSVYHVIFGRDIFTPSWPSHASSSTILRYQDQTVCHHSCRKLFKGK